MNRSFFYLFFLAFSAVSCFMASPSLAKVPLLMEGKRTLYQRVLTRPGALIYPSPGSPGKSIPEFSVLYVYERHVFSGTQWLEVGASSRGNVDGWLPADKAIDWKQTMVAAFGNPAGRNRLPLFGDRAYMVRLLESSDAVRQNDRIVAKLIAGRPPAGVPAVSVEPPNYVDFTRNFYLLPILDAQEVYFANGFSARALHIASVTAQSAPSRTAATPRQTGRSMPTSSRGSGASARSFKTGIAFVIDATISMGPYIERTRETVSGIYSSIKRAGLADQVAFALVAFRDSTDAVPGLEFVSRVYADFNDGSDPRRFLTRASRLKEAKVSSRGFQEDAYAGVLTAINDLDWQGFGGRYIILITDASARDAGDSLSATGLNGTLLHLNAVDKQIAIATLHLLTPAGASDHDHAAAQYKDLSNHPQGNLYYGVPAGDVQQMGMAIESIASELTEQIRQVAENHNGAPSRYKAPPPVNDAGLADLTARLSQVGYAMRLAYLGRVEGTRAPDVFDAWVCDRDVAHPATPALEVRVLLTKNQLSNMQEGLKGIVAAGEKGQLSPKNFFEEIKTAAAIFTRDPTQSGRRSFKNLAESGLLGEYLDDLPYKSKVMSVTQDLWQSWSIGEQQAFLDEISGKIKLYRQFHDDVDRWVSLAPNAPPGEAVYPVPLDALP